MARVSSVDLDRLRPAEKAIYQRLRPLIGRADVEEMATHLRRTHPVWSDVYNITSDRIVEVLERAGLAAEIRFPPPPAKSAANPTPKNRRKKASSQSGRLPLLPVEEPPATATPSRAAGSQSAPDVSAAPAGTEAKPVAGSPAGRVAGSRSGVDGQDSSTAPGRPRIATRSHIVSHVEDPIEQTIPGIPSDQAAEETAPAARKSRQVAKKRPAGSVDELLQQIDLIADDISRVQAEIDQANRRIADLERRRQILTDQLALTLRSRVPVEILRLAAAESAKKSERNDDSRRRSG